ncbi:MAG: DUF2007 domain-containing protein [Methylophilus sp.]|nr:DUF2007 domain-containing protein [Methylophilus sp.]
MNIAYRANTIIEAHIVAGMLQSFGVVCYVSGHYLQGGIGELSPAGFANIFVNEQDMETALRLLKEYERADMQIAEIDTVPVDHKLA